MQETIFFYSTHHSGENDESNFLPILGKEDQETNEGQKAPLPPFRNNPPQTG